MNQLLKFTLKLQFAGRFSSLLCQTVKAPYHGRVIDHFENPRNVGSLDKNAKNVGTGLVGAPACGDVMKLQIQVGEDGKTIEKAVFKVSAPCPSFTLHFLRSLLAQVFLH